VDTTTDHSGNNAAEITATSGTSAAEPGWTTIANLGAITTGQNVQATVWAQGSAATGTTQIVVNWFGPTGTYISKNSSVTLPPGASNWLELGVNSSAPAGAAYANITLQSTGNSGSVWFDDAAVNNLGTAAFPALPPVPATSGVGPVVANPGFQTLVNGVATGWTQAHAPNATMALSTTIGHSSTNSAEITATSGANNAQPAWTTTANLGAITTGQNVQATVWAQDAAATGTSQIALAWYNAAGTYISNSTSVTLRPGTVGWTELGVNSSAPAGAAYAIVSLQSTANTGSVWFDDTTVTNLGTNPFPPFS
jgi:hypothetical protein